MEVVRTTIPFVLPTKKMNYEDILPRTTDKAEVVNHYESGLKIAR